MADSPPSAEPPAAPGPRAVEERIAGREERVHIAIGPTCNNNCLFCMEEDRDLRAAMNGAITPERVLRILEAKRGAEEVCFTSGEPTLVDALPRYARWARQLGYRRVSVMTNGRRLAHAPYAEHLVNAGMNHFYVSLHGHDARLHGGLVREPAAFAQTVAGLENVARLKGRGVVLHTSTVVTRRNFRHFGEIYRFVRARGVDQVVFNVMQANGRAHTNFEQLFPRYREIVEEFRCFLEAEPERPPMAFLVDIPLCTTTGIPDFNRGYVEQYVHHEPRGFREAEPADAPGPDAELVEVTRGFVDAATRAKRPECRRCRYDAACEGVWANYLSRYGWDELQPVLPEAEASERK